MKRRGKKQKMRLEDKILGLLKETPMLMTELEEKSELPMLDVIDVAIFLKKYELIETTSTDKGGGLVKITARGLQLLNLPGLPEDETTASSEFSEETIKWIREREDIRQRKIAGGKKVK